MKVVYHIGAWTLFVSPWAVLLYYNHQIQPYPSWLEIAGLVGLIVCCLSSIYTLVKSRL